MSIEEQFKILILHEYKSVRAFTRSIDVPYSTIDSMLKKGIGGTGINTMIKVCKALDVDLESIETGELKRKSTGQTFAALDFSDNQLVDELERRNDLEESVHTIAAHHEGEEWTQEELDEIEEFKKFVLSKRNK